MYWDQVHVKVASNLDDIMATASRESEENMPEIIII